MLNIYKGCSSSKQFKMEPGQVSEVVQQLLEQYGLTETDCSKLISDTHLDSISHSCCAGGAWKGLTTHLEMDRAVAKDIDRRNAEDGEKRNIFLHKWRQMKGSKATYTKLVSAMLKIEHKLDAEKVLKLLQVSTSSSTQHSQSDIAASQGMQVNSL